MASHNLSSFFLLLLAFVLLVLFPQTQAREGKFFSFFSHFTTTSHKLKSHHPHSPSPSPSPPSESIAATPESILAAPAPAPAPESSTESGTTPVPSPAESEFLDRGDGYGLYGTTSFKNNNDNHESFKTGFGTKLYNNNNNNEELYRNSYNNNNNQEYYSNDHRSNNYYEDSYYSANNNNNNNNNHRHSYKNNNNFYDNNNGYNGGYERKREGMSDTRFVENGKYFYDLNQNNHYEVDGYEPTGRGSTTYTENNNYGGSYYENNNNYRKYPNEFDTMEEYEKQQENQGYVP